MQKQKNLYDIQLSNVLHNEQIQNNLHNTFFIKIIDSVTGKCKKEYQAKNAICPQLKDGLYSGNISYINWIFLSNEEDVSDMTSINNPLGVAISITTVSNEFIDDFTCRYVGKATFPATSSYVGSFNCISTSGSDSRTYFYRYGISKAGIKDAEGNIITIEKTDLDIIEITYYFYCSFSCDDVNLIAQSRPGIINLRNGYLPNVRPNNFSVTFGINITAPLNHLVIPLTSNDGVSYGLDSSRITPSATLGATGTNPYQVNQTLSRINRNQFKGKHYINYVSLNNSGRVGYVPFPNASLFPNYTLNPLLVGIGDGVTTHFDLPLPYFVKDTDSITIGDNTLTRDVDYTIDNYTSAPVYVDVNPWMLNEKKNVTSIYSAGVSRLNLFSFEYDYTAAGYECENGDLIFHAKESFGYPTKVNYWNMSNLLRNNVRTELENLKFILSYSNDEETWTEVATLQVPDNYTELPFFRSASYASFQLYAEFDPIEANYWKIHFDISECSSYISTTTTFCSTPALSGGDYTGMMSGGRDTGDLLYLGYKGEGINFITPPAEGTEIMLTAQMDRPYLTSDYVMDSSFSLEWS